MSLNLTMLACLLARSFNNQINLDILQIYGHQDNLTPGQLRSLFNFLPFYNQITVKNTYIKTSKGTYSLKSMRLRRTKTDTFVDIILCNTGGSRIQR